jgi:hypothetical protein
LAGAGRRRRWMHVCREIQRQRSEDVHTNRTEERGRSVPTTENMNHANTGNGQNAYTCVHVDPLRTNMACTTAAIQEHA